MSKPIILTVDDDPMVSAAIAHDLRSHYGADYRIVRAASGPEALAAEMVLARDVVGFERRGPVRAVLFGDGSGEIEARAVIVDVRLDSMKRVASAVGEGAMPIYLVHRYLATI
jgi:CheY-like chemotaxis protein